MYKSFNSFNSIPRSPLLSLSVTGLLFLLVFSVSAQRLEHADRVPAQSLGAITGVVRLAGDTSVGSTIIENSTDPEQCGKLHSLGDLVVADKSRGIRHVIVALTDVPKSAVPSRRPSKLPDPLVLNNIDCQFVPHASVLRVGDVIRAVNSDTLLHSVHFYGRLTANLALPAKGAEASLTVRRPGMIVVKCDVHGWMQAFIRVDDHPFHAVTDEEGRFRIADVPEGVYSMELWHEKLGIVRRKLQVEPNKTATIEVEYSLEK